MNSLDFRWTWLLHCNLTDCMIILHVFHRQFQSFLIHIGDIITWGHARTALCGIKTMWPEQIVESLCWYFYTTILKKVILKLVKNVNAYYNYNLGWLFCGLLTYLFLLKATVLTCLVILNSLHRDFKFDFDQSWTTDLLFVNWSIIFNVNWRVKTFKGRYKIITFYNFFSDALTKTLNRDLSLGIFLNIHLLHRCLVMSPRYSKSKVLDSTVLDFL